MQLISILIAGLMNGSFTVPTKLLREYNIASVWFWFTFPAMLLLPWGILYFPLHQEFLSIELLKTSTVVIVILGGLCFGIGQACFAYANDKLGVGLAFSVNIGVGILIGTLFVLISKLSLYTNTQILLVVLSLMLISLALFFNYLLGKNNNKYNFSVSMYKLGWLLALVAGCASGIQNITFLHAIGNQESFSFTDNFWVWPIFLSAASLPMLLVFYSRMKNHNINKFVFNIKSIFLLIVMALFFTCSLWLYSRGVSTLPANRQIIAWPVFMTVIILTSQLWSIIFRDYNLKQKLKYLLASIVLLVVSICLLALES